MPSTNATAKGSSILVHPPNLHETHILLCALEAKGRNSRRLEKTPEIRTRTPVQGVHQGSPTSIGSPSASEQATNGTRKSQRVPYSTMAPPPPSSRPRRRDTNPRSTSTTSDRRVTRGLHRLAKPRGPSEARKTAIPAGGDRSTLFRCSQLLGEESREGDSFIMTKDL